IATFFDTPTSMLALKVLLINVLRFERRRPILNKKYPVMTKFNLTTDKANPTLAFCLLMDAIGLATYALPFFGEFADIIWAPISAFIFFRTFGGWKGAF